MPSDLLKEFFDDQGEPGYEGDASAEAAQPVVPRECTFQEQWDYRVHVGDERVAGGMEKRFRTIVRSIDGKTSKTLLAVLMAGNLIGGTRYQGKMGFRYYIGDLPEEERREFLTGIGELAPTAPAPTIRPSGSGVQAVRPAAPVVQSSVPGLYNWDYKVDVCSLRLSLNEVKRYRYIIRKVDNAVSRVLLAHIVEGNIVAGPGYDGKDGTVYYLVDLPGDLKEEFLRGVNEWVEPAQAAVPPPAAPPAAPSSTPPAAAAAPAAPAPAPPAAPAAPSTSSTSRRSSWSRC
jgi:pyruvate/2-oxoglutarate dehydrogenase complex dihydrolipoamide acyltransferase (E2) component